MFRFLAENIIYLLIKKKILDIEDREIYLYAMEGILLNGLILFTILIVSIIGGNMIHFSGMVFFFIPLRVLAGGYHASKSEYCFILTVGIYTVSVALANLCPGLYKYFYAQAIFTMACISVFTWAPLKNRKHPLTDNQYKRNRILTRILILFYAVVLGILISQKTVMATSEIILVVLVAIIFITGKIMTKDKIKLNNL